jgi:hypothetical protein
MSRWKVFAGIISLFIIITIQGVGREISPAGKLLLKRLDVMEVNKHWLPGLRPLNWQTGDPDYSKPEASKRFTHCSEFAAEACRRLEVYILRPPEHSCGFLANAQYEWLAAKGTRYGWSQVTSLIEVQDLANQGNLVVAVCRNPKPKGHGHIALIRPSIKDDTQINTEGPDIIQAGAHNYISTSFKQGFKAHPEELKQKKILFFSHPLQLTSTTAQSLQSIPDGNK